MEQLNLSLCPHYSLPPPPRSSLLLSPGGPSLTLFVLIIFPYANVPFLHNCCMSSLSLIWGNLEGGGEGEGGKVKGGGDKEERAPVIDFKGAIFGEVIS